MAISRTGLLAKIAELELTLARRQAFEAGRRYGRALAEIHRVYETRWDCCIAPE